MINANRAWNEVRVNAKKAMLCGMTYKSLVIGNAYEIVGVGENSITIRRVTRGKNDILTKKVVVKAIGKFNRSGGKVKRRALISPTVAKETALVLFCPFLQWDDSGDYVVSTWYQSN